MFPLVMMLLGFVAGLFSLLQGMKVIPLKAKKDEDAEKFDQRLTQRKFSGVVLLLIGALYAYDWVQLL